MNSSTDVLRISRRTFLRTAATAVGGLVLASCGGGSGSGAGQGAAAPPSASSSPGQANIVAWYWDDSLQLAVDAFHKQQDKIRVTFVKTGYDDTHKKFLTSLVARTGAPDVCALEIGYVGAFAGRGGLLNLSQPPFNADQFKDSMVAYKWAQGSSPDGSLMAMPWDIGPGGLWYRADILGAAGFETDPEQMRQRIKTWDDWLQLGEDLKKKNPNTSLFADAFSDVFMPMVEQQGHGWFNGNKVVVVEKGTKPAQRATEARKRGIDGNIDWWGAEWNAGMKRDAIAGMGIACWEQTGLTRDQPQTVGQWRVIPAPEGGYNSGGSFLAIPQQSTNQAAAWEFVKFVCCTPAGQNTIFKAAGIFPAYKPAWNDPVYDQPVDFFGGQRAYRLWTEIAQTVPANAVNPNDRQASDIVANELTKVEKQGKDPAQAMRDAEDTILKRIPADLSD